MGYGAPLKNQNKGYAAQEKKDLLKDNPVAKVASGGSWLSKHVSSPLAMGKAHGMQPKMESSADSPVELTAEGKKKILASPKANDAFKAAIAKQTPLSHVIAHSHNGKEEKLNKLNEEHGDSDFYERKDVQNLIKNKK